jgi:hypothetical protein
MDGWYGVADKITTYRLTFEKIGRNHNVPSIAVAAREDDDRAQVIAREAFRVARGYLMSADVNVSVEMTDEVPGTGRGWITAGFQTVGTFTITPTLTTEEA